jgi:sensor domain CHASE-containing protein
VTVLLVITLVWVGIVILALVTALTAAAIYLHQARGSLRAIADDLERIAERAQALEPGMAKARGEAEELVASLVRLDAALGRVSRLVPGPAFMERG